jgi:hypothetical protein
MRYNVEVFDELDFDRFEGFITPTKSLVDTTRDKLAGKHEDASFSLLLLLLLLLLLTPLKRTADV